MDFRSFGCRCHLADTWIERARAIAFRHLRQRDHLDPRTMAGRTELLEALAAEISHRVHRGFQEFTRIELAPALRGDLAERRGHRQPAVGVDIDLADAVSDAA